MNEKKGLPIIVLAIPVIVIACMGGYIYKLSTDNSKDNTNEIANNQLSANVVTDNQSLTFSELMNTLYLPEKFNKSNTEYSTTVADIISMQQRDASDNITAVDYTSISIDGNDIKMTIENAENSISETYTITGINKEIVSAQIIGQEAEAMPNVVVFLTRNGEVYYLNSDSIQNKNFVAKKVSNLTEVISLEIVSSLEKDAMEGSSACIASKYDGSIIDITEYLYK